MTWGDFRLRVRALVFGKQMAREIDEELQSHIELETRKYIASGLRAWEARRKANVALGGMVRFSEECRDQRGISLFDHLFRDCRHALRGFRRSPGFALTVVLTMAVAIGANTTVFSFCKAILLATLPVPNPQELHLVAIAYPGLPDEGYFSFPDLQKMEKVSSGVAALAGFTDIVGVHLHNASGTTSTIKGQLVTANFFRTLGLSPLLGRSFDPEDNGTGATAVAAISYRFWKVRFGQDHSAIGKQIRIQQRPVTVVAVMPADFEGVEPGTRPDVWMPLAVQSQIGYQGFASMNNADWAKPWLGQDVSWLHILARSVQDPGGHRINNTLSAFLAREIGAQLPVVTDPHQRLAMLAARVKLTSASGGLPRLAEQFALPLRILSILAGVLLFNGCVNLANLMLARSRARQQEIALRISLGSSRMRLVAQQLTETLLLAGAGGLLSVPLAYTSGVVILRWISMGQNLAIDLWPDWKICVFTAAVTLISGAGIALLPILGQSGSSLSNLLGQRGQATLTGRKPKRGFLASALTGGQIALSVVSLVVAGLLTHTLLNYAHLDTGVDRHHVLSVSIDPSAAGYKSATVSNGLYRRLTAAVDRIPGVISSSVGGCGLMGGGCATIEAAIVGGEKSLRSTTERNYVGARYFSTVGMRLLRGREITEKDNINAVPVSVVNRRFELQFLHGRSALGELVDMDGQKVRIVGVVGDARSDDIHLPAMPFIYLPVEQAAGGWNVSHLQIRTEASPSRIEGLVRTAISDIDRSIPIAEITTLAEETDRGLARELLAGRLAGSFSIVTLLIAGLGLYGVLAFEVGQRRAEIGLRMALGSSKLRILKMIGRHAGLMWCAGCVAGTVLSFLASGLVQSLLFSTGRFDMMAYGLSLSTLLLVSIFAALMPAWRAVNIDPVIALRTE